MQLKSLSYYSFKRICEVLIKFSRAYKPKATRASSSSQQTFVISLICVLPITKNFQSACCYRLEAQTKGAKSSHLWQFRHARSRYIWKFCHDLTQQAVGRSRYLRRVCHAILTISFAYKLVPNKQMKHL